VSKIPQNFLDASAHHTIDNTRPILYITMTSDHASDRSSDTESDSNTQQATYTVQELRLVSSKRFPYAFKLLPGNINIQYRVRPGYLEDTHYFHGIRIGHIVGGQGEIQVVTACMDLAGKVSFHTDNNEASLSRSMRARIVFYTPWHHLKTNAPQPRLREVCALVAWYLMTSGLTTAAKPTLFKRCRTHDFTCFHHAVLNIKKGIMEEEEIDEETLAAQDQLDIITDEENEPSGYRLETPEEDYEDDFGEDNGQGVEPVVTELVEQVDEEEAQTVGTMSQADLLSQMIRLVDPSRKAVLFKELLKLVDPAKKKDATALKSLWEISYGALD